MKSQHQVNVLLVGYESEKWLEKCLQSLAAASSSRLHLCFVDNKNNPTFSEMDLTAFDVEVIKTPKPLGFADANNFGLRHTACESKYTVFLNQDTVSTSGWIDRCVECFENEADVGVISPGLRQYDLCDWEPNLVECVKQKGLGQESLKQSVLELDFVTAAAMAIRTDVLDQNGPFDPFFGSYYEDYDLCRRVRNAGYRVIACTDARVGHFSGSVSVSRQTSKRRARALIRNRLIHKVREHPTHRLRTLLRYAAGLPRNLLRGILQTPSSQPVSATLLGCVDVIRALPRLLSERRDIAEWQKFLREFRNGDSDASAGAARNNPARVSKA